MEKRGSPGKSPSPTFNMEALTRDVALGIKDPKSRKEMLNGPYAEEFIAAEMEEIDNLYSMGTFRRIAGTELLRGERPVSTTWAYKIKLNPDGSISRGG